MSLLHSPFSFGGLTLKNRTVLPPMCQYSAVDGFASDYHFAHLARFALGGFALIVQEATAVTAEGRISYGDLGLWKDDQIAPLKRITTFLHAQGAAAGIQLGHAGRKASTPLWWRGGFNETEAEKAYNGFTEWQPVAPSAIRHADLPGFKDPRALTLDEIAALPGHFAASAIRADKAGYDLIQLHAAHGYLMSEFLSPASNHREDAYGGSRDNRMRLLLEVTEAVRKVWPAHKPLTVRLSVTDGLSGGWSVEDSIILARALKERGVSMIDCSSGGLDGAAVHPAPLYQVPLAKAVRDGAGIATTAVGLITTAQEAESVLTQGEADCIAIGRTALDDPNWPLHAIANLEASTDTYGDWPVQDGFAVRNRDRALKRGPFAG